MQAVKRLARSAIKRFGYYAINRDVMPFGVDFMHDIQRLATKPVNVFFDVGANTGQTSQRALREFPKAHVFAFEPNPKTFSSLTTLVKDERFCAHNVALGSQLGDGHLFCNTTSTRDSLVFSDSGTKISVPIETIDSFSEAHHISMIDVLKTDTEGFDLDVLRGAIKSLASANFVYSEFYDGLGRGTTIADLYSLLSPLGLRLVATYTDSTSPITVANALFIRHSWEAVHNWRP